MKPRNLLTLVLAMFSWSGVVNAGALADVPLSLKASVPPNVLFAVSVSFRPPIPLPSREPMTTSSFEYLGLFDPDKCYLYDTSNSWFSPSNKTANRTCTGGWSGNFLNWATMTGLDEFRFAMTGGNRYRDLADLTVLERTYQDGQGGTSNFPNKTFAGSGATHSKR